MEEFSSLLEKCIKILMMFLHEHKSGSYRGGIFNFISDQYLN